MRLSVILFNNARKLSKVIKFFGPAALTVQSDDDARKSARDLGGKVFCLRRTQNGFRIVFFCFHAVLGQGVLPLETKMLNGFFILNDSL